MVSWLIAFLLVIGVLYTVIGLGWIIVKIIEKIERAASLKKLATATPFSMGSVSCPQRGKQMSMGSRCKLCGEAARNTYPDYPIYFGWLPGAYRHPDSGKVQK